MRYLFVFLFCLLPLRGQWDANGHVQLKLRSNVDVVNEGPSIFSSRAIVDRFDRIIAVRLGQRVPDTTFSVIIERLLPNGEHDPSFGNGGVTVIPFGTVMHDRLHGLFADSSGAIVVVANVGQTPFFVRITPTGVLDTRYGSNGFVWLDSSFTCGKENGVATGHNVSLACSKVIDDTTTRCLLVNVSDRGIVSYEPYISSRCDRFLVYHHGEQFLASGRTIVKLDTNGLIDTTFGGYGSVRWRHLGGEAYTKGLELCNDSTIALLTLEYTAGTCNVECEYMVRFFDSRDGKQADSIAIPFSYYSDPKLSLLMMLIDRDGGIAIAGAYRGEAAKTYPTVLKFTSRYDPDKSLCGSGQCHVDVHDESVTRDVATLSSSQLVLFVTPSTLVRLGEPITSVPQDLPDLSFTIVPNPASNHFTIRAQFSCSLLRYEIVSVIGEVVQEGTTGPDGGVTIDASISRGMYYVRVHRSPGTILGAVLSLN